MNQREQLEEESLIIEEMNSVSIGDRLAFLHKLFTEAVHFKHYDEIWSTDGNPVEIKNVEYLELVGKLLKEMSENGGKIRPFPPKEQQEGNEYERMIDALSQPQ